MSVADPILEMGEGKLREAESLPMVTELRAGQAGTSPPHLLLTIEMHVGPTRSRESPREKVLETYPGH